jgi:hypothetical protein
MSSFGSAGVPAVVDRTFVFWFVFCHSLARDPLIIIITIISTFFLALPFSWVTAPYYLVCLYQPYPYRSCFYQYCLVYSCLISAIFHPLS